MKPVEHIQEIFWQVLQKKAGAEREIYGAHLYPVFAQGRCRLNVTGLPSDPAQASSHVAFFSKYLG